MDVCFNSIVVVGRRFQCEILFVFFQSRAVIFQLALINDSAIEKSGRILWLNLQGGREKPERLGRFAALQPRQAETVESFRMVRAKPESVAEGLFGGSTIATAQL